MSPRWIRALLLLLAVLLGGACGPIAYVNDVTRRASTAVDTARQAQADKYAPYYWTRATQYLHQARVLAAHADFQGANRFGRRAAEAAEQAADEARLAEKDPSRRPLELELDGKGVAPAKDGGEEAPTKGVAPAKGIAPAKEAP